MTVRHHKQDYGRLSTDQLAQWHDVGTAEISDCLDRAQAMFGAIGPLRPGMRVIGQARAVSCMVADNSALHAAITLAEPGDVLVAAAQGFEDVAVWGGLMTRAAMARGIAGLIVDGAVRDSDEIAELGFPCFARCVVPRGPHKGFGGSVDAPVSCGGVTVSSGDLIVADADGVAVVSLARIETTLGAVRALQEREAATIAKIADGASLADIYGVPEIAVITPQTQT
ncbi:RraA family protein [Dichotomicrobium thermohalophilum]|uniref:Putative 4-hydroxy-4-methyl-2-oxoglutarate aldolase n=1 Tax=Dichotomicrobium thermohalophilum TaxID=933063 RepID=A0A397Q599_9HYPH|nr:RraA family protein [Dichotomicrobium thermohalophilum]RIA56228.1 regulator of RNase E activity RraA [Dichotomicrobium thermohalophilum]